ncbi:MAG: response regulator [Candidatus Kapabacteria bacterium]|nr:response regulator [Candidatus Kapabacteria bacterium]MCS7169140.1 response regulator [Candidatus Kapabacteria bacterium]MDW7996473.1 response regulator [Bacteroidota bacterium]MDW8225908.1 response regulator [Bacteroidota bacterium]
MGVPYVLVVDDNRITVKLLRRYLEKHGYEVAEAYDGTECLETVAQRAPDAIVLDVMMPQMDGYTTVRRLRQQEETALVPVVIVTALNDVSNQVRAIEAGADDFLGKPVDERLLIAKVKLLTTLSHLRRGCRLLYDHVRQTGAGVSLPPELYEIWDSLGLGEPPPSA